MTSSADWIPARTFKPKRLAGLTQHILEAVSPTTAAWYLDHLLRLRLRRLGEVPHPGGAPISLLGAFELDIGIARAAQILRAGLEASDVPVHPMDCSAVLRPMPGPPRPRPAAPTHGTMVFCVNPPK